MSKEFMLEKTGEDNIVVDTKESYDYGNYMALLQIRKLGYSEIEVEQQMNMSSEQILDLEDQFDPGDE